MYSTKHWKYKTEQCGSYTSVGSCYNREHSFPKSWFGDASPMVSDAFHIYPTDGKVNGQRSNFPYGECASGTTLSAPSGIKALGRLGRSTFPGYSGTVFEPDDQYKGDFARSYFYMAACYKDRIAGWSSDMLAGNSYPAFSSWAVNLLLKWHRQDPVSDKERKRNEAVYAAQRNRNPFIDHPEMAEYIWGDKKSERWTSAGVAEPKINLPVDGSALDLGVTAVGVSVKRDVTVKTSSAKSASTVDISGAGYSVSPASLAAEATNAEKGATASVVFTPTGTGTFNGTLTITNGSARSAVALSCRVVDGLPAGPAADITDNSFTAVWTYIGDADASGNYSLKVCEASGASIDGYPRKVPASAGRYSVDGLDPTTEYFYTVSSSSMTSAKVAVSTVAPVPSVDFLFDGELVFYSSPGTASAIAEILVETEHIDGDVEVTVDAPFELSADKSAWGRKLVLSADEDRMYMRMLGDTDGSYTTVIKARAAGLLFDDAMATGIISSSPAFLEDFENYTLGLGSYGDKEYQGNACRWYLSDCGFWGGDPVHSGLYAARGGRDRGAVLEMAEDKRNGIGMVKFYACKWNGDDDAVLELYFSTNGGVSYTLAGQAGINSTEYSEYSIPVNAYGKVRLKFSQKSGRRILIDDISATDLFSGVKDPAADYHRWDTYAAAGGGLVVENFGEDGLMVSVYSLDGISRFSGAVAHGQTLVEGLEPGLYIVVVGDYSRRVVTGLR